MNGALQQQVRERSNDPLGIAIIGAGERGVYCLGAQMVALYQETGLSIIGLYDQLPNRAVLGAKDLNSLYAEQGIEHKVRTYASLDAVLDDPAVDLVVVTTRTNQHREPVLRALAAGKKVYLDKPISVTLEDAQAIQAAEQHAGTPVIMGFTRRYETPWMEVVRLVNAGIIGTLQMALLRSVIPYHRYMQRWHRESHISGGALNDKCSHHFDVLNWLAGSDCLSVNAIGGRSGVFAPDPAAPRRCSECDRDCPYRNRSGLADQEEGAGKTPNASWTEAENPMNRDDSCVYSPGSDIDDHAIVSLNYSNGVKASLFFTIFGPWSPDQETLEVVGSSGRIRMERSSGKIDVVSDYGKKQETIEFNDAERNTTHFGADRQLVRKLRAFYDGETPPVGVSEGVKSLRIVLAAQQSIRLHGQSVSLNQSVDDPWMKTVKGIAKC